MVCFLKAAHMMLMAISDKIVVCPVHLEELAVTVICDMSCNCYKIKSTKEVSQVT